MTTFEFVGQYQNEQEAIEDCMWRASVEGITRKRFLSIQPFGGDKGGSKGGGGRKTRAGDWWSVFIRGRDPLAS